MKQLVVVESPTKAKTLAKFLSSEYRVMSTMGHIRDLPNSNEEIPKNIKDKEWSSIGIDYTSGFKPYYVVNKQKKIIFDELKKQLKDASALILATDNDREGESISWHLLEVLKPKIPVKRIVFKQITKEAIFDALEHYRELDKNLVSAQETRRILDRLVGYTISPLLWKKIAYRLSAGRVQSVAMNLIVEKELERMKFVSANYWRLNALLSKNNIDFESSLIAVHQKPIAIGKDFNEKTGKLKNDKYLLDKDKALTLIETIKNADWIVKDITTKKQEQKAHPPFITSTLQQAASNKLRFSAKKIMRIAQNLYEKGYITYMRTDSISLNPSTIQNIRSVIKKKFGENYLPPKPYDYKSKSKTAQEAHEAINPVNLSLEAKDIHESPAEKILYDLIWKKTLASQMSPIQKEFLHLDIQVEDCLFRSTGKKTIHLGYAIVYQDTQKDIDQELPQVKIGEKIPCKNIEPNEHNTIPPSRYTEASLIKFLEKKDIGRPSTYSSIISTIIDREYVKKKMDNLVPTFIAFAVSKFLKDNFPELTDIAFTAKMESTLDNIATGKQQQKEYLENFYNGKNGLLTNVKEKTKSISLETYKKLELPGLPEIKISTYGAYIQKIENQKIKNINIPEEIAPSDLNKDNIEELLNNQKKDNKIGLDPKTREPIYLLQGRYGHYLQIGLGENTQKPKRAISKQLVQKGIDLNIALILFSLPIELGIDNNNKISIGTSKYGTYLLKETNDGKKEYRSINIEQIQNLDLAAAIQIFNQKKTYSKSKKLLRNIGIHPVDNNSIDIYSGIYGNYIKYSKYNVSLPKEVDFKKLDLQTALSLIEKKLTTKKKNNYNSYSLKI